MTETPPAPEPAAALPSRPSPDRRRLLVWIAIAAVVLIIAFGLWLAYRPQPDQLQGMVEAKEVTIATKVPLSRVEKVLVKEGQPVTAGQPLIILSSPELEAKTDAAQGLLAGAKATEARVDRGAVEEDIASLQAIWQAAQAAATLAQKTYVRTSNLYAEGVVAAQRRDEALAARDASARNAEAARQQYLKAVRGATQEAKDIAAAQVQVAQAGVREAASMTADTRLSAPHAGEIAKVMVKGGELAPLAFPLFTLIDLSDVWVTVNVREDQFHGLQRGQVIRGSIPALDRKNVAFRVEYISPQGDFATWRATRQSRGYDIRSFEIHAKPVQKAPGLRPGMSVLFDWPQR
ncbi:HlyD family secretion protein [Caulobacter mirabilis]|uniref:HlyD family secretion protein n=1 Tax=Caulobacter mirabilis TaxID=69666 RepID=UPI001FE85747|nr:efflux RND transporter periplasmic adaptor subunit [Caulobacter mirabilis]